MEKDLYIIADEIYEKLIYGDARHVSIASLSPEIYQRTIVINGMSKAYHMTGWRIGYSAAPLDLPRASAPCKAMSPPTAPPLCSGPPWRPWSTARRA